MHAETEVFMIPLRFPFLLTKNKKQFSVLTLLFTLWKQQNGQCGLTIVLQKIYGDNIFFVQYFFHLLCHLCVNVPEKTMEFHLKIKSHMMEEEEGSISSPNGTLSWNFSALILHKCSYFVNILDLFKNLAMPIANQKTRIG